MSQHRLCSCSCAAKRIERNYWGCKAVSAANRMLPRQQALRCLRSRNSFASLQTGPSVYSSTRIACYADSRPCDVCGAATLLRPCQPALRSFRARASHGSLAAGLAVFVNVLSEIIGDVQPCLPHIACFPDNRPCGVCGAATPLRPCKPALRSIRARASHASPIAGPVVFAGPQVV